MDDGTAGRAAAILQRHVPNLPSEAVSQPSIGFLQAKLQQMESVKARLSSFGKTSSRSQILQLADHSSKAIACA